jgi:hypothetical protein
VDGGLKLLGTLVLINIFHILLLSNLSRLSVLNICEYFGLQLDLDYFLRLIASFALHLISLANYYPQRRSSPQTFCIHCSQDPSDAQFMLFN